MTVDSLNIANGNASALVMKHQGKNLIDTSLQRSCQNPTTKPEAGKAQTVNSTSKKSLFEINKSQTPLNKPVEPSPESLGGILYSDVSHKSKPVLNVNSFLGLQRPDETQISPEVNNPALVEQSGWFITIVPDKRTNGGFLELVEKREERKRNLKEFYNPIVNFNKGKLLDLVG